MGSGSSRRRGPWPRPGTSTATAAPRRSTRAPRSGSATGTCESPFSAVGRPAGQRDAPGLLLGDGHRDRFRLRVGARLLVGRPGTGYRLTGHLPQADDLGPGPDGRALALGVL